MAYQGLVYKEVSKVELEAIQLRQEHVRLSSDMDRIARLVADRVFHPRRINQFLAFAVRLAGFEEQAGKLELGLHLNNVATEAELAYSTQIAAAGYHLNRNRDEYIGMAQAEMAGSHQLRPLGQVAVVAEGQ